MNRVRVSATLALTCALFWSAPTTAAPGPAAAAVAQFRANPGTSADALERAAVAVPTLAEPLTLLAAEARLAAGDRAGAARLLQTIASTRRPWRGRVHWALARALPDSACQARLDALDSAPAEPPFVPEADRLELESAVARGCGPAASARATKARRTLAIHWPDAAAGARAAVGLVLSVDDRIEQAGAYERARDYVAARAVLTQLAEDAPEPGQRDRARMAWARIELDRVREDFALAGRLFDQVAAGGGPDALEAQYLAAKSLGRRGELAAAIAAYDAFIARAPTAPQAADARFFRVFLRYEAGDYAGVIEPFARLASEPGPWREAARWYAAFARVMARQDGAGEAMLELASSTLDPSTARRARYWAAQALRAQSPEQAATLERALVTADPLDWYSVLIRLERPKGLADVAPLPVIRDALPAPVSPKALAPALEQVRLLVRAGLHEFARAALGQVWIDLRKPGRWALAAHYAALTDDWSKLHRAAHLEGQRALAGVPDAAYASMWRSAWPQAFPKHVEASATASRLRPGDVWSFMLKESAFRPAVVSGAHAVGLMQLLPRTAAALQAAAGRPSEPLADLFDPAVNIGLACEYLRLLADRFGGQLPLVAAAYNAGPESVASWFRGRPTERLDVFVENIPFRETRDYVKKVVEFAVTYRVVHGGLPLSRAVEGLSPTLDLTPRLGVTF